MSMNTPAVCGQAICGKTICGQNGFNLNVDNISAADYGENPKINLATGRIIYEHSGLSVGGGTYAMGISLIYNSAQNVNAFSCGTGWKLNIHQQLIEKNGEYKYIDAKGGVNTFVQFDSANSRYYNTVDAGQVLTVPSDGQAYISDGAGNKIYFNSDGSVSKTVSGINANIQKVFEYDNLGRITKIYDGRLKFSDKIRTYLSFAYDQEYGMLKSVTAYDKYTVIRAKELYEYDTSDCIKLIAIKRAAFNGNGVEMGRKTIKEFSYHSDGKLKSITDTETRSASRFAYGSDDEVTEIKFGVIQESGISLGMGAISGTDFSISGAGEDENFIEKTRNTYTYNKENGKIYETDVTNENGVKTAYFLDTKYRIVSRFERTASNNIRTFEKSSSKRLDLRSYSSHTHSGQLINGCCTYESSAFYIATNNAYNLSYNEKNENKYYDCSFWLKHNLDRERLKVKFEYKLTGNTAYRTEYAWINGRANKAWQKVSVLLTLNKDGDGNYNSNALTACRITLCEASGASAGTFMISDLYFSPAPKVGTYAIDDLFTFPISKNEYFCIACQNTTYEIENNQTATDTYLTENDIVRSLMNRYAQPTVLNNTTYFDIICNDGTKRLSRACNFILRSNNQTCNLLTADMPVVTETIMANNKVRVVQGYSFEANQFTLTSWNYYRENGMEGDSSSDDHSTTNSEVYNYLGQKLSETDEYGVKIQYEYDDYGQLIRTKKIGSDGTIGEISEAVYDENKENVKTTMCGFASSDYSYLSPFALNNETTQNYYDSANNAYCNTNDRKKLSYDAYNDRVTRVAQYNGSTLVAQNDITYENGRIRSVTDGYVKYGAKHDFVNDKMEYTRFSDDTEIVMQTDTIEKNGTDKIHTSTFNGNFHSPIATTVDKYDRVKKIAEGGTDKVAYTYQNGSESAAAQKIFSVTDNFEGKTTTYDYDCYNNLIGWSKGTNHLTVEQITAGDTKYTFGENEKYYSHINYDENKVMSPRISSTGASRDPNNDNDDDVKEFVEYRKHYTYDGLGRLTKKQIATNNQQQSYSYLKMGGCNTSVPIQTVYSLNKQEQILTTQLDYHISYRESYTYDKRGNISGVQNKIWSYYDSTTYNAYVATGTDRYTKIDKTQSKEYTYDALNRLTKETDSLFGTSTYTYGANGKLSQIVKGSTTKFLTYNTNDQLMTYDGASYSYDGLGNRASKTKSGFTLYYGYTRGNLLSSMQFAGMGNAVRYYYNAEGVRFQKIVDGVTTNYYLDGNKILGEDRGDDKLRYFYDIDGLCGIRYNGENYVVIRNAYGDVTTILKDKDVMAQYFYDAWGNCQVFTYNNDDIGNINPFRWKGHYYDTESGLYYANGSYYDPDVGLHVDAVKISSVIENAFEIFGLDINGIMCDNILAYLPNAYAIFTTMELSANPDYDPNDNKPWWELTWNAIVNFFAPVLQWFNDLAIGWKILVGSLVIIVLGILTALIGGVPGVILGAAFITSLKSAVIGVVSGAISGAISAIINQENILNGIIEGGVDGFLIGSITGALFGTASATIRYISGSTRIVGTAQKALYYTKSNGTKVKGTFFHRMASNIVAGKMVLSGQYSVVALDKSLNSVGLIGRKMPDVIGIAKSGSNKFVEVVSKSQTVLQMTKKLQIICNANPNSIYLVIEWAAIIGRILF